VLMFSATCSCKILMAIESLFFHKNLIQWTVCSLAFLLCSKQHVIIIYSNDVCGLHSVLNFLSFVGIIFP
jgi:hypothetical protein